MADHRDHHPDEPAPPPATTEHSFRSDPPPGGPRRRRSQWAETFAEARADAGVWRQVTTPFTRSTASQLTSDLNCNHRRRHIRVRGTIPGERWESRYRQLDDGTWAVWLRFVGPPPPSPTAAPGR